MFHRASRNTDRKEAETGQPTGPYASRRALKGRGYRWSGDEGRRPRTWYRDVMGSDADAECAWLDAEVYRGRAPQWEQTPLDAFVRYSDRV